MKLRKSIFVTALVAGMLVVINLCLYFLDSPAYLVLTGGVVLYGFFCAVRWISAAGCVSPIPPPSALRQKRNRLP